MSAPGWLTRSRADVPAGDGWLSAGERAVLAGLRVDKRRADWLLGRWAAKLAAGAWLGVRADRLEILAAADGAPEAYLDGHPAPVVVSLSHRAGRALVVVSDAGAALGCDLELLEPRSDAFVREWLSAAEQALVAAIPLGERSHAANLLWTAKEATAKALREGLRLDVKSVVVEIDRTRTSTRGWSGLRASCEGVAVAGWWRTEPGWVMTVAGDPAPAAPRALSEERVAMALFVGVHE